MNFTIILPIIVIFLILSICFYFLTILTINLSCTRPFDADWLSHTTKKSNGILEKQQQKQHQTQRLRSHTCPLTDTHTHQCNLPIGEWQPEPMVKRNERAHDTRHTNDENQVRNNKTKCRRCCCFVFCVFFLFSYSYLLSQRVCMQMSCGKARWI